MLAVIVPLCLISVQIVASFETSASNQTVECVDLYDLPGLAVMRGFGELRQVNKVRLYLSGNANVDVSVSVVDRFINDDYNEPSLYECDHYQGTVNGEEIVEISCLEDNADEPDYGYGRSGYAVHTQFKPGTEMQHLVICKMDIMLRDRGDKLKEEMTHSVVVFSAILSSLFVLAAISIVVWYIVVNRKSNRASSFRDDYNEFVFKVEDINDFRLQDECE